ncbi:MAG: hypothetical protein A3K19_13350 [Lentisphaerae bacterium RIFOXYB12_FULL_65_16]|nr:MAG: hypothetical protein A3K18_28870 [Lentisphaerae bacterium RIFOXYA12_64_32]OGV86281.1 MAG: hypothetical protein A3K19_13350 [Lentisphaerae bacterium RIFOXYB12_FULL_65_16]
MSLLGIDLGTTGCKAVAFSECGQALASAYQEYATLHPHEGWNELDSTDVWRKVKTVVADVAARTKKDPITALSISSLGEAMTPVTRDRRILGRSILCSDSRGDDGLAPLRTQLGQKRFYAINPNILGVNYSLPKLWWTRENEPDLYTKADLFLLWGDLVAFLLGGEPLTGHSLANRTLLFDIRREDWSDRLLKLAGIPRAKLAKTVPAGTIAGTVSKRVAAELGLAPNVKIVIGGHDQCCNSLGAGICRAGSAVCGIGTFECITPTYDHIPRNTGDMLANGLNIEHHILPGLYVSFIYNQGGVLVKWFRDTFAAAERTKVRGKADIYDRLSAEMPADPTRLLVLPYFEMSGPPNFVADAAGAIVGLKTTTTRGEILKAIMECETLYFVDSLNALRTLGIDTSEFVATGGGAKSDVWLQIKADVFGIPFVRPRITEATVLGAAILAGISTGVFANAAEGVSRFVARDRVFEPDPKRHAAYREKFERYRSLLPTLHPLLKTL